VASRRADRESRRGGCLKPSCGDQCCDSGVASPHGDRESPRGGRVFPSDQSTCGDHCCHAGLANHRGDCENRCGGCLKTSDPSGCGDYCCDSDGGDSLLHLAPLATVRVVRVVLITDALIIIHVKYYNFQLNRNFKSGNWRRYTIHCDAKKPKSGVGRGEV